MIAGRPPLLILLPPLLSHLSCYPGFVGGIQLLEQPLITKCGKIVWPIQVDSFSAQGTEGGFGLLGLDLVILGMPGGRPEQVMASPQGSLNSALLELVGVLQPAIPRSFSSTPLTRSNLS